MQKHIEKILAAAVIVTALFIASPKAQETVIAALRGFNGSTLEPGRTMSLANSAVSTTLTGRSLAGVLMFERPTRWSVVSAPAVSTLSSSSIAAEAGVRHVADCVSFSAGSTTAPVLTALTVNLRDGASGAGTVVHTWQVTVSAATGQNVLPFMECGLNIAGTTNTAMTLEFSSLLTNLIETTSLSGYNIQ